MPIVTPLQSITETMHKRVCPLYSFDAAGKPHMVGSAVPFATDKGAFLITAAHVCFDHRKQPTPLFTWADSGPLPLREFRIAWDHELGKTPDADVALLALSYDDVETLKRSYWFSDPATVSAARRKAPGIHYVIAGYPFSRNRITSTDLAPPAIATYLITGDIELARPGKNFDKSEEHHFALTFPLTPLRTIDGERFRVPKPRGMSGGGIWSLDIDATNRMATTPQLVGIGIEYYATKEVRLFLGTRVQLALSLAADLHHFMKTGSVPVR